MKQEYEIRKMLKKLSVLERHSINEVNFKNVQVAEKVLKWVLKNE